MNFDFLKSLLIPIIKEKDTFSADYISGATGNIVKISLHVSSSDVKKIIGYGGRVYRSIRTILRYKFNNPSLELLVDIAQKKAV
jgi:predicted RNA-binding protein YlqC (UPF0109 family)